MAYPVNTCNKSLIMLMRETKTTPRAATSSPPSSPHVFTVNIRLTFECVRSDWIARPNTSVQEFVQEVESELKRYSISFDYLQFLRPERLRHTIAGGIAGWPLSPPEIHELVGIAVSRAAVVVGSISPRDTDRVYVNFRVVENHMHSSGEAPPPATVLLGCVSENFPCPRSASFPSCPYWFETKEAKRAACLASAVRFYDVSQY